MDDIDTIVENSYKDFHVKGFDYICLLRTPDRTEKLYFFNGDVAKAPEVVAPHDHRYDFRTEVLYGEVHNILYRKADIRDLQKMQGAGAWYSPKPFEAFEYRTPLNGGNGFTWKETTHLIETGRGQYRARQDSTEYYFMEHRDLHTIKIVAPNTVLKLTQYKDEVPKDGFTTTYTKDREPPSLSGLYNKFTADEVIRRLALLSAREFIK